MISGTKIISNPLFCFADSAGLPLAGGKVYTYATGTTTPKTTYSDYDGNVQNANPVVLDSSGQAIIYGTGSYKLVIKDSNDVTLKTIDPYVVVSISNYALTLLDDTNAATARTTLGLGTAATKNFYTGTGDAANLLLTMDSQGRFPAIDARNLTNLSYSIPGLLNGMELSWGSATSITIASGYCWDSVPTDIWGKISLSTSITKFTTAWVEGNNNGGLDTGSIGNNWYYVYAIKNLAGTKNDVVFSLSATSPSMPSGYTLYRRIGSFRTNSSNEIIKFSQSGDNFFYRNAQEELAYQSITSGTKVSRTLSFIPPAMNTVAMLNIIGASVSGSDSMCLTVINSETELPSIVNPTTTEFAINFYPPCSISMDSDQTGGHQGTVSGTVPICFKSSDSNSVDIYNGYADHGTPDVAITALFYLYTLGWTDTRGK